MFRLGIGILVGWLMFDDTGKKVADKMGGLIKDKSDDVFDEISKHIDTDKITSFIKKQLTPESLVQNEVQDVLVDEAVENLAGVAVTESAIEAERRKQESLNNQLSAMSA